MTRVHRSQVREILLQLTVLKTDLESVYWDIGEDTTVEKSLAIKKAISNLGTAIENLTGAI